MTVLGTNKTGKTIPETTPNRLIASDFDIPAPISIAGSKTATADETKDALARTEVIGRDALNRGFKLLTGLAILPPRIKNQTMERVKENR